MALFCAFWGEITTAPQFNEYYISATLELPSIATNSCNIIRHTVMKSHQIKRIKPGDFQRAPDKPLEVFAIFHSCRFI